MLKNFRIVLFGSMADCSVVVKFTVICVPKAEIDVPSYFFTPYNSVVS